jgi:diguanylate cyclase (GGDEF)-like protein
MEKPVSPRVVMASAAQILGRLRSDASILVVDDDPTVAAYLGELLGAGGVHVEGLSDPRRLWAALEELRPDLLVLDLDMPDIDGLELCRMVRNDEAWSALPIVFLTGTDESEWNREMFAAGADDHIPKPMVADDVTTRISNRLERARDQRRRDVDSRSGLAGAPTFTWEVDRLLSLSRRRGFPLAVAVVELDDAGTIEGEHGRAAVDDALAAIGRLLSRTARPEEAAGWAGDRRLAIAMFDQETTPAVERLAKFLEAVRAEDAILKSTPLRVTASVGVSVSPRDGEATGALLAVAGDALERAQDAGGDRVSATAGGGPEGGGSLVDVMVVDDDEALGTLLMHALATRGYRARWLLDGAEAATLLVDHEAMGARVVLLDVGLPGLDGLSVLRKLAEAGVLRSTRVIMLTLRSSDAEVLEALELGAFDHVAKPFSVPVLLHRIARALDSLPA